MNYSIYNCREIISCKYSTKSQKILVYEETVRSDREKFFALVSTDEKVKDEMKKAILGAIEGVAKDHGFDVALLEDLSEDELEAVAGGCCPFGLYHWITRYLS